MIDIITTPSFNPSKYIKWKDIIRCPYAFKDQRWSEWSRKDDNRLLLIALDRYADELQRK